MTHFPDSSGEFADPNPSQHPSKPQLQTALSTGLAALKQQDYATAIACLESCQTSLDATTRLKAQMGLIKAYVQCHRVDAAIALCQPLCQHSHPQVQAWANQTLSELTNRSRPASRTDLKPDSSIHSSPLPAPPSSETQISDPTGFTPLPPASSAPVPSLDSSSLAPLPSAPRPTPPPSSPSSPPSPAQLTPRSSPSPWTNAGRAQKWNFLGKVDASGLWVLEAGSLVLLFWLVRTLLEWVVSLWNGAWIRLNWFTGLPRLTLPTDLTLLVLIGLGLVIVSSPWLYERLLRHRHGLQSFSLTDLERHSPEANRLIKRWSNQYRRPVPNLALLPVTVPLLFTYGYLPRNACIVVSQGLLNLPEDEVATLLAAELAHLCYWDFGVLSVLVLVAQAPYQVYWRVAAWGDRQRDRVLKTVAVIISALGYGLFRLLRGTGLWLSRVRLYYGDRLATDLTGNPNGLTRALLKSAIGIADDIQQQRQTSALLESFDLLMPVGYRTALAPGSLYNTDQALEANHFNWDWFNPYRRWLILNNSHPTLGERIQLLMQYANHWRLQPEIVGWQGSRSAQSNVRFSSQRLLLQGAPWFGILFGLTVGLLLWAVGWLTRQWRWVDLTWLADDGSILLACGLLGFSIGLFLRINAFFPDIKPANLRVEPSLASLLSEPNSLPLDSVPVQLTGQLIGRRGFHNWLYQDLLLQTPTGTIRLHYTSSLGWIGNLFPKALRPPAWIERTVTVKGWFRRGATPWIDVEMMQADGSGRGTVYGRTLRSYHPIWSTVLAGVGVLLAVYLILGG